MWQVAVGRAGLNARCLGYKVCALSIWPKGYALGQVARAHDQRSTMAYHRVSLPHTQWLQCGWHPIQFPLAGSIKISVLHCRKQHSEHPSVSDWMVFQTIRRTPQIWFLLLWARGPNSSPFLPLLSSFKNIFSWNFPPVLLLHFIPAPLLQKQILLLTPVGPQDSQARQDLGKGLFQSVNYRVRVQVEVFDLHTASEQQLSQA